MDEVFSCGDDVTIRLRSGCSTGDSPHSSDEQGFRGSVTGDDLVSDHPLFVHLKGGECVPPDYRLPIGRRFSPDGLVRPTNDRCRAVPRSLPVRPADNGCVSVTHCTTTRV